MSGKSKQKGTLLYTKNNKIKSNEQDLRVITSGAGRVFKSGIPIGKIKYDINNLYIDKKIVDFYSDFSQLKYVKVVSYTKEQNILDSSSKKNNKDVEDKILQLNQRKENIKILIEEKKIASEIRIKYEEENNYLENKVINLQRQLEASTNINKKNKIDKEELKFLRLNLLYGKKCAKNFYNKLYKVGSVKYRECVLSKGTKKN
jgi:rod shape-determining protein MreC